MEPVWGHGDKAVTTRNPTRDAALGHEHRVHGLGHRHAVVAGREAVDSPAAGGSGAVLSGLGRGPPTSLHLLHSSLTPLCRLPGPAPRGTAGTGRRRSSRGRGESCLSKRPVRPPSEAAELNSEPRNTHMRIYHNRSFNLYENKQTKKKSVFLASKGRRPNPSTLWPCGGATQPWWLRNLSI